MTFPQDMLARYAQVANRVEQLYANSDPAQVHEHQRWLQEVQKSPEGYEVALFLLAQESATCQYFGALTFTVILLQPDFDSAKCQRLVSDLLAHTKVLLLDPANTNKHVVVIRKLMSNVSIAHVKHYRTFANPILSFAQIFSPDGSDHLNRLDFAPLVSQISPTQLALFLVFLSILVEDISKSNDFRSQLHVAVRDQLFPLVLTAYQYLTYLKTQHRLLTELDSQALKTLHSWMSYIPNMNGDARYDDIGGLVAFLSLHFADISADHPDPVSLDLMRQTFVIFNEILELNPNIFSHEQKQTLYATVLGPWGTKFIDTVVFGSCDDGFQEETTAYTDVVLSILQLNSIRLSRTILDSGTQSILALALRLTSAEGTPFVDELVSERMLLFWEDFASIYKDSSDVFETLFEAQNDAQFLARFEAEKRGIFDTVARVYWRKLHLPDLETYKDRRAEFNSYRSNVADFFFVLYALLKTDFYLQMCDALLQSSLDISINDSNLLDTEATMYLLYKINDDTVYFESQANLLAPLAAQIFDSGFLTRFGSLKPTDSVRETVLATFIQFCSSNVFYFKTAGGNTHLGSVFSIIVLLLLNSTSPGIALLASKAAMHVCEGCSGHLVGFLPDLETVVVGMLNNPHTDSLTRLRMFNAYSVIARSMDDEEQYSKTLYGTVSAIADAASAVIRSNGDSSKSSFLDAEEDYLSSLLSCLVNIAKGSSLSDDTINEMLEAGQEKYRDFWQKDPYSIKHIVLSVVQEFSLTNPVLAQNPIFVEKCTLILKAGLGEKLGGGFSVGTEAVLQYAVALMESAPNANAVPFIFGLVECLVSVEHPSIDPGVMLQVVHSIFTNKLSFLKSDPDMIKSAIDLFSKILECKPALLLYSEIFTSTVVQFAVEGLAVDTPFVVESILRFWTRFLSARRGTSDDHARFQTIFREMNLAHVVTAELIAAFVKCARSNLDYYYTIFRKMIAKFPMHFKESLLSTLHSETLVRKVGAKELDLFVYKLMVTRGRRTANEVLKLFWLAANGFVDYNTQKI